jgi:agmatinase
MNKEFFRGILTEELETAKVTLTAIPYDEGCSCGKGASLAPDKIRELSSFLPPLTMDGKLIDDVKIYDFGNIEKTLNYFEKIKEEAVNRLELHKFPIFIGGDHSISIPLQEAFYDYCQKINKIPAIIHLDAHPDICDFYDGSKLSHACTNKRSIDYGYQTENITLIGIRGFEKEEVAYLDSHKELKVYTANECYNYGIQNIINDLKNKFSDQYAIYLSYDIDINDPSFAPGTGTPEAFGLSSRMVLELIMGLFNNLNIKAFDIVEVSPTLDCNDITSWLALKTIYEVLNVLKEKL